MGDAAYFPDAKPIKLMAYADDLLIFLHEPREWQPLLDNLQLHHSASKTQKSTLKKRRFFRCQAMTNNLARTA